MREALMKYFVKGSDWQCMVVELRMQYFGEIFQDSLETYKTF